MQILLPINYQFRPNLETITGRTQFNGPSGNALDNLILEPLGLNEKMHGFAI